MVDYVYRNRPSGRLLIGRLLDRIYLSHEAWQAVRIRKAHLTELLEQTIERQLDTFGEVLVLDVASGQAKYLQDVLVKFMGRRVEALCWDTDERWLEEGEQAAMDLGLRSLFYERGDALDARSFRRLPRRPHVAIASGFYDWIEQDERVRRSFRLLHDALLPGGRFVFTIQTGHAALEATNMLFAHYDGGPLRMRTRPAAAVHRWARCAGFEIECVRSDDRGYYAVSLAVKR
jgi:SAM-dependent methyltransferase